MAAITEFEMQLLNSKVNLADLKKAEPLKTQEELRLDWLRQRQGRFTASEFHRLVANPNKPNELPKGALTYAYEKAAELLADIDPNDAFVSRDMQWGIDHELEAIAAFEERTGMIVHSSGVNQALITLGNDIAATPDGMTDRGGVEIKCPKSTTHAQYLMITDQEQLKEKVPEYYWQMQGGMYVSGCDRWFFFSYDPRFKDKALRLHTLFIVRNNEDIELLQTRLLLAIVARDEMVNKLKAMAGKNEN